MNEVNQITEILTTLIQKFVAAIPGLIGSIILIIIGLILASIVSKVIVRVLTTVKVDVLADKLKEVDLFASLDVKISKIIGQLTYWMILMIFAIAATEVAGLKVISEGIGQLVAYIPKLMSAMLFFIIGVFIANIIKNVVQAACHSMAVAGGKFIALFVFYFLFIVIAITALNQAGIDTAIITQNVTLAMGAIFFAFAIGYGFASKDIMASVLASFYSRNKFEIGQTIRMEGIQGEIIAIDSTSVTLDAGDKKIIFPLSKLLNSIVEVL